MHAGDYFLSTMDATRKLQNSLVLLPRGRFDQNTLFADLVYRLNGATKMTFRFDNAFTVISLPQLEGRLDNVSIAGTMTIERIISSHHQLTGTYSFIHVDSAESADFGKRFECQFDDPRIHLYHKSGAVGSLIRADKSKGPSRHSTGLPTIEKKLGGVWVAAGYQRYLGFFGGFTPEGGVPVLRDRLHASRQRSHRPARLRERSHSEFGLSGNFVPRVRTI